MNLPDDSAKKVAAAMGRLRASGLFADAGDAVSLMLPGTGLMLYAQAGGEPRALGLSSSLEGTAALHAGSYRLRPDAGAVATVSAKWSLMAARARACMPPVFDEQVRHIGASWPASSGKNLARALARGGNAGVVDDRLLVLGVTMNRMLFNAELFEKCAKAFTLAQSSGYPVARIPWWVRAIAGRRLLADERRAGRDHLAGRETPELQAY